MWDWDHSQPHPFDFRSPLIFRCALNTSWAGGSEESYPWPPDIGGHLREVWVRALLQAFLPHQQKYINNKRQCGIWKEKGMWNQTDRLRLCNLGQFILPSEPLSLSLCSTSLGLYGDQLQIQWPLVESTGEGLVPSLCWWIYYSLCSLVCLSRQPPSQPSLTTYYRWGTET